MVSTHSEQLPERIGTLPYAFTSEAEVPVLMTLCSWACAGNASARSTLLERLDAEVRTHEVCDNWRKADVIRTVALRVRELT